MNLSESLSYLRDRLSDLSEETIVFEDKGHLDHPEDLVFLQDISGANRAIDSVVKTVTNPNTVTIKWDGYPALIFGRDATGKFSIMDKHMFNKKDLSGRQVYSPQEFVQYDQARGVERGDLSRIIAEIWPGLEKASKDSKGYYWGDLLFSSPLEDKNGQYTFKANPNGITYTVDASSDVGKLMSGKIAGIAVHQYIEPNAPSTDFAQTLDGTIGNLKNNSNVAIIPSKMPNTPKLKLDNKLLNQVKSDISQYGEAVHQLMNSAPQARNTFNQLFTTYINKRIVSGDLSNLAQGFMDYVATRPMTDAMRNKISQHLNDNKDGIMGAFTIWSDIYNLKMSIVAQLNKAAESSPVQGYLQDGTNTQEGFVSNGLKFVDRMGFSRQNLSGR
jgi:hypothetical protein